jgi:aspartyl-tRNA synthetase
MRGVFEEFAGSDRAVAPGPFPRIPYRAAIAKFGTDKPDLRNPIEMQDVTDAFKGGGFGVFASMIDQDERVRIWAVPAPGGGSRAFCDRMGNWAKGEGQAGLAYIFWRPGEAGGAGPVAKNLGPDRCEVIRTMLGLGEGDGVFFVAGDPKAMYKFAGLARTKVGSELKLIAADEFRFCWIVDFPMYEWNEEEKKIDFSHNPFSMPQGGLQALDGPDPLDVLAYQYDIVCNGVELSSGAIRNHRPDIMMRAFQIAGYAPEQVEAEFGGMLNAFRYGAPPHGGIAPGIDRIVMLLAGQEAIREVIAFPMNQQGQDLLMNAPAPATEKQLKELHLRPVKL